MWTPCASVCRLIQGQTSFYSKLNMLDSNVLEKMREWAVNLDMENLSSIRRISSALQSVGNT